MPFESIHPVCVPCEEVELVGDLVIPAHPLGAVIFAHDATSSRYSERDRFIAAELRRAFFATLLLDVMTPREQEVDRLTAHLRFNVGLLGRRLACAVDFVRFDARTRQLPIGLFGAGAGAAIALSAAAHRAEHVAAIVSRSGRPDLAHAALAIMQTPILLIVGGDDEADIRLNQESMRLMRSEAQLSIVPGATRTFDQPGAMSKAALLAADFFISHLRPIESAVMTDGLESQPATPA